MDAHRQFVNQLVREQMVDEVFLVRDKDLRTTKAGDLFIVCTLCDRTGHISARLWRATQRIFEGIPTDGFLHIKGRVDEYRGELQLIIDSCRPVAGEKVDLADFLAVTELDVEVMWSELLEILRAVKDPHIRLLIKKFVEDRDLVAAFKKSPAAMQMHHPFIGGLLEHTLNVAKAAAALLPMYPEMNVDLVLGGVFLHDIGKTAELSAGTTINYTERGMLIGHITMAVLWLNEKARQIAEETSEPFPEKTLTLLEHIILSHHGEFEFGSPKLPAIPEAYFIHHLDNLDAKIFMTTHQIANDPDPSSHFTAYSRQLQTRLYKHSGQLQ